MIADLKSYPAMKDSKVPWLGHLPNHWDIKRAKYFFREADDRSATGEEELLSVSHITGVTPRSQKNITMFLAESNIGHKICQPNDIVVNTMWAWMAALGVARQRGIVSPSYAVYRPLSDSGLLPEYLDRLLRTQECASEYLRASTGVNTSRLRLYPERFLRIFIPRPPTVEQALILRFLDHMDRRIRHYIRAKQRVIALLEEQKQAMIHRAVTRGLDPNVHLKPSGVDWLGDVPEHWEVLSLRRVITRAVDGPHHSPVYRDSGIPFLSARNIKADRWSLEDAKYISEEDHAEFSKRIVPEVGDVLYTKGGTTGVARAVDLEFRFQVWVHVAVLKVQKTKVLPRYLALVLNSPRCYEQAQLLTRGATNQDLGLGRMKGILFVLPRVSEQKEILSAIEDQTRELVRGIEQSRREIGLLRELRTRLIADVVTGKLDVREEAAKLPEVPDDLDIADESTASDDEDVVSEGATDEMSAEEIEA